MLPRNAFGSCNDLLGTGLGLSSVKNKIHQRKTNTNSRMKMVLTSCSSVPASPHKRVYPVYLRPEQNIPDVYLGGNDSKFAPIGVKNMEEEGFNKKPRERISMDDIVVTVRSAQV